MSDGYRTDEEVNMRCGDSVQLAAVVEPGRFLVVCGVDSLIREACQVFTEPLEVGLPADPGQDLLAYRAQQHGATLRHQLSPFEDQPAIARTQVRLASAQCQGP